MFYVYLIQAFLHDTSLFSDVKAIVDTELLLDPAEIIRLCKIVCSQKDPTITPRLVEQHLGPPGGDLEVCALKIHMKFGRDNFIQKILKKQGPIVRRRRATMEPRTGNKKFEEALQQIRDGNRESARDSNAQDGPKGHSSAKDEPRSKDEPTGKGGPVGKGEPMGSKVLEEARKIKRHSTMFSSGDVVELGSYLNLTNPTAEKVDAEGVEVLENMKKQEAELAARLGLNKTNMVKSDSLPVHGNVGSSQSLDAYAKDAPVIDDASQREDILEEYQKRLQNLGMQLIQLWSKFYRRVRPGLAHNRTSLIMLPNPFIVPGGRFIEIYYWDSYWIIRGLLSSGLPHVARDTIENFLYMVDRYGFIPNGSRKYYQDRSQPPFLSSMLHGYYLATKDYAFLEKAFPTLQKEYEFWMNPRLGHAVKLNYVQNLDGTITHTRPQGVVGGEQENQGGAPAAEEDEGFRYKLKPEGWKSCILNRFFSLEYTPRPESYRIDEELGQLFLKEHSRDQLKEFYRNIRAGAESGWDFSSRWLRPAITGLGEWGIRPDQDDDKRQLQKACLLDIDTTNVIPCDLNAMMYLFEKDLAVFSYILGKRQLYKLYRQASLRRRNSMMNFLWDPNRGMWLDFDMKTRKLSQVISAASFVPLWANINPELKHDLPPIEELTGPWEETQWRVEQTFQDDLKRVQLASNLSPIVRPHGIVTTQIQAGLQWDSPNVWACLHHMAVEFLCGGRFWEYEIPAKNFDTPALKLAIVWASRFVNTVLDRFDLTGTCSEKYHCYRSGQSGMDGEYKTQEGFGWTNGVVLDFLELFNSRLVPQGLVSIRQHR